MRFKLRIVAVAALGLQAVVAYAQVDQGLVQARATGDHGIVVAQYVSERIQWKILYADGSGAEAIDEQLTLEVPASDNRLLILGAANPDLEDGEFRLLEGVRVVAVSPSGVRVGDVIDGADDRLIDAAAKFGLTQFPAPPLPDEKDQCELQRLKYLAHIQYRETLAQQRNIGAGAAFGADQGLQSLTVVNPSAELDGEWKLEISGAPQGERVLVVALLLPFELTEDDAAELRAAAEQISDAISEQGSKELLWSSCGQCKFAAWATVTAIATAAVSTGGSGSAPAAATGFWALAKAFGKKQLKTMSLKVFIEEAFVGFMWMLGNDPKCARSNLSEVCCNFVSGGDICDSPCNAKPLGPGEYDWSDGWTTVKFTSVGCRPLLFLLKESNGTVHLHSMNYDGSVGRQIKGYDWSQGWTTVEFFTQGDKTYLFLLKEKTKWKLFKKRHGLVHIHELNEDGTVGKRVDERKWSKGWTTAKFFDAGNKTYLFLLKEQDGIVHIHEMGSGGKVGDQVASYHWSGGWEDLSVKGSWSSVEFFQMGGQTYLFLLKRWNGSVHIHKMNADGTVGDQVYDANWKGGWSSARFFRQRDADGVEQTYLFQLKENRGNVHINRMNADGTVGKRVYDKDWTHGWTSAEFFRVGKQTYLFLLKEESGKVHIHRMDADGTVGPYVGS